MALYKSAQRTSAGGFWTPSRMRIAGTLAIVGGIFLFARIAFGAYLETQMSILPWDAVGSLAYYLSEGILVGIWACVFVGFVALRARLVGKGGRLWNSGSLLAIVGTAIATLGFGIVTVVPVVGAETLVGPGNAFIGLGGTLLTGVGAFLMGIALLRMQVMSRFVAATLILTLPVSTGGVAFMELIVGQQYWIGMMTILPLCVAVVLLGNYLRTETPDVMPPSDISD